MFYPYIQRESLDKERNLAIEGFGHRIYDDQTLYEYLLEFLLIFISPKGWGRGKIGEAKPFCFPDPRPIDQPTENLFYQPIARIGLKRFVFFSRSKQEGRFPIDQQAYSKTVHALQSNIQHSISGFQSKDGVFLIQDLLYSFNAVLRNRSWFAQSLLPIAPELTFVEAMGNAKRRKNFPSTAPFRDVDGGFEFKGHYFLARGGEVYFLHLLNGLLTMPELKHPLEEGLLRLTKQAFPEFSWIAQWIEQIWLDQMDVDEPIMVTKSCEWVPSGYSRRAALSCEEVVNLLQAELPELQKLDLLAKGIVLQVLRMMHEQAKQIIADEQPPIWIVDINSRPQTNMRKFSASSYRACEEDFTNALNTLASKPTTLSSKNAPLEGDDRVQALKKGAEHTSRLFRRLGKEIGLVIPPKGTSMRFSLNEDIVKFLVVSIIKPGQKMLLSHFLKELYRRFGLVIGPAELGEHKDSFGTNDFDENHTQFQDLLKRCGFLRDLSDATAIVENPFGGD